MREGPGKQAVWAKRPDSPRPHTPHPRLPFSWPDQILPRTGLELGGGGGGEEGGRLEKYCLAWCPLGTLGGLCPSPHSVEGPGWGMEVMRRSGRKKWNAFCAEGCRGLPSSYLSALSSRSHG